MGAEPGRIAAGYEHTCVLTSDRGVNCWGANYNGQLGNGRTSASGVPVDVYGLEGGVIAVTAGAFHSCALTAAGGVKCWGSNEYGQLGDGTTVYSPVPIDVDGLASGVFAIAAGWSSTCALTSAGGVKCWGHNAFGGLGDGTTSDSSVPVDVSGLESGVSAIATGSLHACALTVNGGVTCWGEGQSDNPDVFNTAVPVDVPGLASGIAVISATLDMTCAVTNDGRVVCWGLNYAPPPGESSPARFFEVDVSHLADRVRSIAVNQTHGCALTNRGAVACWSPSQAPVDVAGLAGDVVAVAAGGLHSCAVTAGGEVRCWGNNRSGQLGSTMRCSSTSVPVEVRLDGEPAPAPTVEPTWVPKGPIEHATGPTDVVLRLDFGPDLGVSELEGEFFRPGPEFTLYGDGTVIFRHDLDREAQTNGPILRAAPFMTALLDETQVQSLLLFALGEGGLADACDVYPSPDTDFAGRAILSVRADGIDRQVEVAGPSPLGQLVDRLAGYDPEVGAQPRVWEADRYWGNLLDAGSAIELGLLPDPLDVGSVPWPWPAIRPADFVGRDMGGWIGDPRRVMSVAEAAVLDMSAAGGVVRRVYVVGPDGTTIYSFSLWPMALEEVP
jgi:alpha-tubulin suppressor-like RCC1 family protein